MSASSKLPSTPFDAADHLSPIFFEHKKVSFVGRPFRLDEADIHFSRLRSWGLTFVRLLVPWEALGILYLMLEHAGPGMYDNEYIKYLIGLLKLAPKYGIKCFIGKFEYI